MEKRIHRGNLFTMALVIMNIACSFLLAPIAMKFKLGMYPIMAMANLIMLLIPLIIYFIKTKESPKEVLRLNGISGKNIGFIVLIAIFIQPLMNYISGVMALFLPNNVGKLLSQNLGTPLIVKLIVIAVMPAVLEELCMRGVVLSNYKHIGIKKAALITGILFGILHMNLQMLLYTFILGVVFAYLVYITDSIFSSMLAHFIVNGTQVVFATLSANNAAKTGKDAAAAINALNSSMAAKLGFVIGGAVVAFISFIIVRALMRKLAAANGKDLKNIDREETSYEMDDYKECNEVNSSVEEISSSVEKKTKIMDTPFIVIIVIYSIINVISLCKIFM